MRVTVAIPTKDRPGKLALTLLGLCFQTSSEFQVLVRDEGEVSAMDNREVRQAWDLLSQQTKCFYYRVRPTTGLVLGRKDMLTHITSEFVFWLDDDIVLQPITAIERLLGLWEDGDGFVTGIIHDIDNARGHDDYDQTVKSYPEWFNLGHTKHFVSCEKICRVRVWMGIGCCIFTKTDIARNVACYDFDHRTKGEAEDMIACLRIADKYPCWLDTGIHAMHFADPGGNWAWARVATNLVQMVSEEGGVSLDTLRRAGMLGTGYKVVK